MSCAWRALREMSSSREDRPNEHKIKDLPCERGTLFVFTRESNLKHKLTLCCRCHMDTESRLSPFSMACSLLFETHPAPPPQHTAHGAAVRWPQCGPLGNATYHTVLKAVCQGSLFRVFNLRHQCRSPRCLL